MHLGLIGGIGPAATVLYYEGLVAAHAEADAKLELTIAHAESRVLVANFLAKRPREQAEVFARHVAQLKAAGAEIAAVTSMGGHFCIRELAEISPLPLNDAVPVLDAGLKAMGLGRVGLLGTNAVMQTGVYGGLTSVGWVAPEGDRLARVHEHYVKMATSGRVTEEQRQVFFEEGARMIGTQGAEAVVLAGTDLFLAFRGHDPGYPTIDAADIHVAELARLSMGG